MILGQYLNPFSPRVIIEKNNNDNNNKKKWNPSGNEMDLNDIYRTFLPKHQKFTFLTKTP